VSMNSGTSVTALIDIRFHTVLLFGEGCLGGVVVTDCIRGVFEGHWQMRCATRACC
jgi:hypothetical protein